MPIPTPMTITLYDPITSEVKNTFTRLFVPWKMLKKAVQLSKSLGAENLTEADVDMIAALVVEAFGNVFTVDELNEGADLSEMMTVLQTIVAKAGGSPNVFMPGKN